MAKPYSDAPEIVTFAPAGNGSRMSAFTVEGLRVTVTGNDAADNPAARALAEFLANWSKAWSRGPFARAET